MILDRLADGDSGWKCQSLLIDAAIASLDREIRSSDDPGRGAFCTRRQRLARHVAAVGAGFPYQHRHEFSTSICQFAF